MIWSILPDTKAMMLMIMIRHKYIQILYHRSSHFFVHSQNWNVRHSRNSRSLQRFSHYTVSPTKGILIIQQHLPFDSLETKKHSASRGFRVAA